MKNSNMGDLDTSKTKFYYIFTNNLKTTLVIIIFITTLIGVYIFKNKTNNIETKQVKISEIADYIVVSGKIQPSQESQISFEKNGRIKEVLVQVGNSVNKGQILAKLDTSDESNSIMSAKTALSQAEANLEDIKNGASDIEISIKKENLRAATDSINASYRNNIDIANNIYSSIFDILNNKLSTIFSYTSNNYTLLKNTCNQSLSSTIEKRRLELDSELKTFENIKDDLLTKTDLEEHNINILNSNALKITRKTALLLNNLNELYSTACTASDRNLDDTRLLISNNKKTADNLIDIINNNSDKLLNEKSKLNNAKLSLEQTLIGSTPEKIKSLEAQVENARVNLLKAENSYEKNFIKAPFDGIVTSVKINKGEMSGNSSTINIISNGDFQVKAKLSDIDVTKVKIGNEALITLDAYGNKKIFRGYLLSIDPSMTKEGNSGYYFTNLSIKSEPDDIIKNDMAAEAKIITNYKSNSLVLDSRFIYTENQKTYANLYKYNNKEKITPEQCIKTEIKTGILDNNNQLEIVEGLKEGDIICAPDKNK